MVRHQSFKVQQAVIAVYIILFPFLSEAQSLEDHLQKADRFYLKKDYENALKSYEEVLALDANDPLTNFKAGVSALNEENFSQAVVYLERAYELKTDVDSDINYHLGNAYQKDHQYAKARQHFETLKGKNKRLAPLANKRIRECLIADSLMKISVNAKVLPVTGEINTVFSEVAPLIGPHGKTLIFTSDRTSENYEIKSRTNSGDVYISRKNGATWETPEKIGHNINVRLHESATSVSADGNTLLIYYEDGAGDIYTSQLENGEWTKPVSLNKFINHPEYTESSACLSPDGKKLFFASNRPGGKGGFDLYVSELGANGQWGRPSNLGSAINTRGSEETPFFHANGTLYFSSDGQATLGETDIFKSTVSNGKWSTPQNLGYPINTSGYEAYFVLSEDQSTGYFATRRSPHRENTQIYQVDFGTSDDGQGLSHIATTSGTQEKATAPHDKVTVLQGSVIDVTDTKPLEATLTLVDNSTKEVVAKTGTDASGNFKIIIPRGGNYGLTTARTGYLFNSINFDLPAFEKYQEVDTHILMVRAKIGSKVILKNVFFDVNQSQLKKESQSELENIRDLLMQHPQWRIQINGHTDNVGPRNANISLSLKRAEAVVEYLIKEGISRERLSAKGFGPDEPLVSNDDEKDGRQINRRTEIEIIGQ